MSTIGIYAGVTYFSPLPGLPKHLAVIVYGPFVPNGYSTKHVICVNITTLKEHSMGDKTCVLKIRDHVFIHHDSIVNYQLAKCLPVDRCCIDFESGRFHQKQLMKPEILKVICDGLMTSIHTPKKIKAFLAIDRGEAAV